MQGRRYRYDRYVVFTCVPGLRYERDSDSIGRLCPIFRGRRPGAAALSAGRSGGDAGERMPSLLGLRLACVGRSRRLQPPRLQLH